MRAVTFLLPTDDRKPTADSTRLRRDPTFSFGRNARTFGVCLQTLHLYGAGGIVAFGWAMCELVGAVAAPWMPLWFFAALLFYNVDRLRRDPSDAFNTPRREAAARQLRRWSWFLAAGAAIGLLTIPLARRDWITLGSIIGGGLVCLNYSLPLGDFRLKEAPLLKTFFAPGLVTAAVFGLPLLHKPDLLSLGFLVAAIWSSLFLFCNMALCDLRDIPGDRRFGVVSVPSRLGIPRTRKLLWILLAAGFMLALAETRIAGARRREWVSVAALSAAYLGGIVHAARRERSERFYEWWVEGLLFIPSIAVLAARF